MEEAHQTLEGIHGLKYGAIFLMRWLRYQNNRSVTAIVFRGSRDHIMAGSRATIKPYQYFMQCYSGIIIRKSRLGIMMCTVLQRGSFFSWQSRVILSPHESAPVEFQGPHDGAASCSTPSPDFRSIHTCLPCPDGSTLMLTHLLSTLLLALLLLLLLLMRRLSSICQRGTPYRTVPYGKQPWKTSLGHFPQSDTALRKQAGS